MIKFRNLSFSHGADSQLTFPDWEIGPDEHALILGNSGSGKTTLLHLIGGLLQPKTGQISLLGTSLQELSSSQLDQFRGKHLGFVFQQNHLIAALTVEENLQLAIFFSQKIIGKGEITRVLERLNIDHLAHRKPHEISQGQAQRVAIARAVIHSPEIIIGDELTSNLDDENCHEVMELLQEQARICKATLVMATHDQRVKSEFANQLVL